MGQKFTSDVTGWLWFMDSQLDLHHLKVRLGWKSRLPRSFTQIAAGKGHQYFAGPWHIYGSLLGDSEKTLSPLIRKKYPGETLSRAPTSTLISPWRAREWVLKTAVTILEPWGKGQRNSRAASTNPLIWLTSWTKPANFHTHASCCVRKTNSYLFKSLLCGISHYLLQFSLMKASNQTREARESFLKNVASAQEQKCG